MIKHPLLDLFIPSRQNQVWTESGMDSWADCADKKHFKKYPYPVEYRYNSQGFRDQEWPTLFDQLQTAIWCIGDSFTVGLGSPVEHTWTNILNKETGIRTINISLDGASNNWIARRTLDIIKAVQPSIVVIQWSFLHRREADPTDSNFLNSFWTDFYKAVRDSSWPNCETTDQLDNLPAYIKKEIIEVHKWPAPISDEELRIFYNNSTTEQDLANTVDCIKQVEKTKGHTKIIHSIIPDAADQAVWNTIQQAVGTSDSFIPVFPRLDFARDGYHYDKKTAKYFVDQVVNLINVERAT
jgi:hypothetical protein